MVNAHAQQTGDNRIEGYFDSTGRLWGGPDKVRIWFVAEFSKPFEGLTAWNDGTITPPCHTAGGLAPRHPTKRGHELQRRTYRRHVCRLYPQGRRASGWKSAFHPHIKLIMPRRADGSWLHEDPLNGWGFEESNAWQTTFGLSHQIKELAALMGGEDSLCARLNHAFEQSAGSNFIYSYGGGHICYSNQPGLSNAHVFAHAGHPELTQYWARQVRQKVYSGITPEEGYGGHDEDQGQMAAVSTLISIGLFSIDGGSSSKPCYDITAPLFDEVLIRLHPAYNKGKELRITTRNNSSQNCYIKSARLNGHTLASPSISHQQLSEGGILELELAGKP